MRTGIVDLYQYYGIEAPENASGTLEYLLPANMDVVAARRSRPAVLVIPGGGYNHVSPREAEPIALRFCAQGYGAFILRYSVKPVGFPAALREAAMAMRYIREHGQEMGVDPHMVAAVGFSAGGHLCGCLGTMYDAPELADIGAAALLRPDALGLCYPVAVSWGRTHENSFKILAGEDKALWDRLSLDRRVRPDMPPVFLWHTRWDTDVPVRNSLLLASALEEAGVCFTLHIYNKGPHGLSTADELVYPADKLPDISPCVPGWLEHMQEFFREQGFGIRDLEVRK